MKIINRIKRFVCKEISGQGMVEYGLIVGVISILVIGTFLVVGRNTKGIYESAEPMQNLGEGQEASRSSFLSTMNAKQGGIYYASTMPGYLYHYGFWSMPWGYDYEIDVPVDGSAGWKTKNWTGRDGKTIMVWWAPCSTVSGYFAFPGFYSEEGGEPSNPKYCP